MQFLVVHGAKALEHELLICDPKAYCLKEHKIYFDNHIKASPNVPLGL